MKIDTADYLTIQDVMRELDCPRRAVYRALKRASESGHECKAEVVFGKRLFRRSALQVIKDHYYPYYSDAHQKMVRSWGSMGGAAKAKNATARPSGRKRASASGKSDGPAAD